MKITKKHIPGVVKYHYHGGTPTMIVLHETANQHSTIDNESDYVDRTWGSAFYHYLVSDDKIYEKADPKYLAWGAGPKANPFAIHIELVRNNGHEFDKAYSNYIWLARHLANKFKIPLVFNRQQNGIVTHNWVSINMGGTDHSDPDSWLNHNGISLSRLEEDLKNGKEDDVITDDHKYFIRVISSEVKGWDRDKVHSGKLDARELKHWKGKKTIDFTQQAWDEGAAYRAKKDKWENFYKKYNGKVSKLEKENAELKKKLANATGTELDKETKDAIHKTNENVGWIRNVLNKVFK